MKKTALMESHSPFSSKVMAPSSENPRTALSGSPLPSFRLTSSTSTFFSISDADIVRFLRMFTFLPMDEIAEIENQMLENKTGYVPNTAQRRLAEEVTRFVHRQQRRLKEALKATEALRSGAETKLDWDQVLSLSVLEVSVCSGLMESKSAARRLIKQGGLYLNNERVDGEGKRVTEGDIVDGEVILLSEGKKNKMIVWISSS